MNSVVANPQISADYFPPVTKGNLTPRQQYNRGYQAFCYLIDMDEMTTPDEIAGYKAAMRDCADIETDIYLTKQVWQ